MPDSEQDLLAALDALSRKAAKNEPPSAPSVAAPPARPANAIADAALPPSAAPPKPRVTACLIRAPQPPAEQNGGPAPAARVVEPPRSPEGTEYRCLGCGYPLQAETNHRCAECGLTFEPATLKHWFAGAEQRRFADVNWVIRVFLIVQLLALPEALGLTTLGFQLHRIWDLVCILLSVWAFGAALRGRWTTVGGRYGILGCLLATTWLMVASNWYWGQPEGVDYMERASATLLPLLAPLLVLTMLSEPPQLASGRRARRLLIPLAIGLTVVITWLPMIGEVPLPLPGVLSSLTSGSGIDLVQTVAPRVAIVVMWGLAATWLGRVQRTIFGAAPRAS